MPDDGKFLILSLLFINTDHLICNSENKFENIFINVILLIFFSIILTVK